jgi:3-oxoacyl-[acyl-carrier protein] reductase
LICHNLSDRWSKTNQMFDTNAFSGYRVLITGSSRGIGHNVAIALRRLGADIAVHGTAAPDAKQYGEGSGAVFTLAGDFRKEGTAADVVSAAADQLGGLDCLINNAGTMMGRNPIIDLTPQLYRQIVDLNATSLVEASIAAIPALSESPRASIINTTSISARTGGSPGSSIYSSAKAFVSTFTRSSAREMAPRGIRVNAVSPGTIMTDFHIRYSTPEKLAATAMSIPLCRLGEAADCTSAYLFLAHADASSYMTGQIIEVNGGSLMP